jgi:drug/metabolite transporter (DMT)-like permease
MGGIAICIGFFSITRLGIIKASVIVYMYPVFATLFGCLLLKERLSCGRIAATAVAFAGACVLMLDKKGNGGLLSGFGIYEIIAVAGAIIGGLTVVSVKKLQETDTTPAIFFAQCLVGLWIVLIPASVDTGNISLSSSMILVAIGLLATAGQLLSTDSYRYMTVSNGSLFVMVSPILSCLAGILLFHEQATLQTLAGAGMVLGSAGFALWEKE